jgi:hypothetical protein
VPQTQREIAATTPDRRGDGRLVDTTTMNLRSLIAKLVGAAAFLLAAFSHVLFDIAPPNEGRVGLVIAVVSLASLAILLLLTAIAERRQSYGIKQRWLEAAAAAFVVGFATAPFYINNFEQRTFAYPAADSVGEATYFRGTVLTAQAAQYLRANPGGSLADLVDSFGGLSARTMVWTPSSTTSAKILLTANYLLLALALATGVFSLAQALIGVHPVDDAPFPEL